MTVATGTHPSVFIRPGAELALFYAEGLLKSIPAEQFAHMPSKQEGRIVNSPAFNIGHLAIYPDTRMLPLLGREDLARPLPFEADLFKAGAPCLDTPGAYPSKDLLVETFTSRHRAVIEALATLPEETFARPNPMEGRFREMMPTVGAVVNFLLVGHTQSHLGQISVWRRLMGLGPAF